jgi:hypothetical protein
MVLLTCRSSLIRFRPEMSPEFTSVFNGLRGILEKNAASLSVGKDRPDYIGLEAQVGPATLQAWGGRQKSATIPVAWVPSGKAYVSYHLMGVYPSPSCWRGAPNNCARACRASLASISRPSTKHCSPS